MAFKIYKLTYYAELAQADGGLVRVEFYAKYNREERIKAKEIGDVIQGLSLEVQGQSEDIDAPIVKTSLIMSVVDAPEKNTEDLKCGDWQQFYTSDATGWKVVLLGKSKGETEFRTLWGGYVTPDSYTETLCFHGVVSITARDNIGLLQEMDFDGVGNADDMITPYELINQAWAKINSPMLLDWRGYEDENVWLQAEGVNAPDTYLCLSALKDLTWYDALYNVLQSYGIAMRYTGNNGVSVCPLRRLPVQGLTYDIIPKKVPTFTAYATRELTPAVKDIEDVVSYNLVDGKNVAAVKIEEFQEDVVNSVIVTLYKALDQQTVAAPIMPLSNSGDIGWGNIETSSIFFNPHIYNLASPGIQKLINEQTFMVVNSAERTSWYGLNINRIAPVTLKIERGVYIQLDQLGVASSWTTFPDEPFKIKGAIKFTHNGIEYWWNKNKSWTTEYVDSTYEFDENGVIELPLTFGSFSGNGVLQFFFLGISINDWSSYPTYLGIKGVSILAGSQTSLTEQNTVRTVYDESNNMRVVRNPMFGPVYNEVALPEFINNGIFRKDGDIYLPTPAWKWFDDEDSETMQLSAQIHRQLLCYHSKPNNLLSGTIVGMDLTRPAVLWTWKDSELMLLSGTYNFCNGRIENAQLREFIRYENLW